MGMKHRHRCADAYVRERLHEKMKNRTDTTESEKATSVMKSENSKSGMREALARDRMYGKPVVVAGIVLIVMELWKQLTLWLLVEGGQYNVWYFPFQLCSLPMYLALLYGMLRKRTGRRAVIIKRALLTFLQDYGFLGGALALIVHEGLMHPGHPLLTAHGFIWHIVMLLTALYIHATGLSDRSCRGFRRTLPIFGIAAVLAELINIALHRYGDCDMFYITPYHLSSQPVFRSIDAVIGRPAGILLYLGCVVLGAFLVHLLFSLRSRFGQ